MPSTTTNYSLALYDTSSDTAETFANYRAAMAGTGAGSNMNLIDTALDDIQTQVTALETQLGVVSVDGTYVSPGVYTATVTGITSYVTNSFIRLKLDVASNGAITININTLGAKSVKKVNISGTKTDLVGDDFKDETEYICRYDGTDYVWNNAISIDQIFVKDGTITTEFLGNDTVGGGVIPSGVLETGLARRFAGKTTAPTATDDTGSGYRVGDWWFDETNDHAYIAIDVTASNAVWKRATGNIGLTDINVFTASGTWNKPSDCHHVVVEVVGGGGGGGGCVGTVSEASVGNGGGGGGYSKEYIIESSLGATETVTVGTGGAGGAAGNNNGSDGVASSFGAHCSANGGGGGNGRASAAVFPNNGAFLGGGGGTATGGDINVQGGASTPGVIWSSTDITPSKGGVSVFGGQTQRNAGDTDGLAGQNYGGGGTGGQATNTATDYAGGDGADGVVIVYEYGYL